MKKFPLILGFILLGFGGMLYVNPSSVIPITQSITTQKTRAVEYISMIMGGGGLLSFFYIVIAGAEQDLT